MKNWLDPMQSTIWHIHQEQRLGHALLLHGVKGLGKVALARQLASSLLCESPSEAGFACTQCKSCQLLLAGSHPDLLQVAPEEAGKAIKIDQIRHFNQQIYLSAQYSGYRVAIIQAADTMNMAAQNSLLKTLEEPPSKVVIFLIAEQLGALLPTIRSRCQQRLIPVPQRSQALEWLISQQLPAEEAELLLDQAQGAPLFALELHSTETQASRKERLTEFLQVIAGSEGPLSLSASWNKQWSKQLLSWLLAWVGDLIRLKTTHTTDHLLNKDFAQQMNTLVPELSLTLLFGYLDWLNEIKRSKQALNTQLLTEDLLIRAAGLKA